MKANVVDLAPGPGGESAVCANREQRRRIAARLVDRCGQLRKIRGRLGALVALNREMAFEREPGRLLDRVCEGLRDLAGCRHAFLGVTSLADPVLVQIRTVGTTAAVAERFRALRLDVGVTKQVMVDRRPHRFYNPAGDPLAVGLSGDYPLVHSGLLAPISSPSRVYGWILLVDALADDAFTDEDERLLSVTAGQLGRVYENAILEGRVRQAGQELEREAGHRRRTSDDLRDSERRFDELARRLEDGKGR